MAPSTPSFTFTQSTDTSSLPHHSAEAIKDGKLEASLPAGGTEAAICPGHYRQVRAQKHNPRPRVRKTLQSDAFSFQRIARECHLFCPRHPTGAWIENRQAYNLARLERPS